MAAEDTIVAVSSPPGRGDRAIVRLSGPRAIAVASRVAGRRLHRVRGATDAGALSAWVMPRPLSYTREDVVELHLPGAEPLVRDTVERCLKAGARAAEPGEFTRRAFLNGRLDLAQAESVQAVIAAGSEAELGAALALLRGAFSRDVRAIEERMLALCADVEAAIDFEDQDIRLIDPREALARTRDARASLDDLLSRTAARRVAGGPPTAFLWGRPNAGKSSLFNRLTGGGAIVSDAPGTTRDVLAGECAGMRLLDAPGVFDAEGLDAEAVRRARAEAERADLLIVVIDATDPREPEGAAGREVVRVVNKCDLRRDLPTGEAVCTSAMTGEGIEELRRRLAQFAAGAGGEAAQARLAVSVRQRGRLREAAAALRKAEEALAGGLGMEFVALDLRAALEAVGAVTGRHVADDLLERIFETFCVGK